MSNDSQGLYKREAGQLETGLLTLWNDILQRVDRTDTMLQKENLDLLSATKKLETLEKCLKGKRDLVEEYDNKRLAMNGRQETNYQVNRKWTVFNDQKGVWKQKQTLILGLYSEPMFF